MLFLQLLLLTTNRLFYNENKFGPLLTTYVVGTYAYLFFIYVWCILFQEESLFRNVVCVCV